MKKILIGIVVIIVIAAAYVCYNRSVNVPPVIVGENLEGEADPSRMTLGMKTWIWMSVKKGEVVTVQPKKASAFTLDFKNDGTFAATTDCNHIGGQVAANDGVIKFSNMHMTNMFCEGSQEADFSKILERAVAYRFTSRGELIFDIGQGGQAIFR